jgi:hypothetical protein
MAIVNWGGIGRKGGGVPGAVVNRRKVAAGFRSGGAQNRKFRGQQADKRQQSLDSSEVQSAE